MYQKFPLRSSDSFQGLPSSAQGELTAKLLNLKAPITQAEREFLRSWSKILPGEKWEKLLLSWSRGLAAYGTPLSVLKGVELHVERFRESGQEWPALKRIVPKETQDLKNELIKNQPTYIPRSVPAFRHDLSCNLCENVIQGEDARKFPLEVANNIMMRVGEFIIAPNRYPLAPGAMLWMRAPHDDLTNRIIPGTLPPATTEGKPILVFTPESGKTRDALLIVQELIQLFTTAKELWVIALRNHVVSGKSMRWHDHWQLNPLATYPHLWFENLIGGEKLPRNLREFRATGTPYDILVLRDDSIERLAAKAAEIMNNLERGNVIFSPYFIPGPTHCTVLIAPLKENSGDSPIPIGAGIPAHEVMNPGAHERFSQFVPLRGTFPWKKYGATSTMATTVETPLTQKEVFERYIPIQYSSMTEITKGPLDVMDLNLREEKIYNALKEQQDQRGDPGHTSTVVHFTRALSELHNLTSDEREANTIAAIVHDAGWGLIPNINEVWGGLATKVHSGDPALEKTAREEMKRLRKVHEREATRLARKYAPHQRYIDEICTTVEDHDTRAGRLPERLRPFLDGDWLWRSTMFSRYAKSSGEYDRNDPNVVYKTLKKEFTPHDFLLPASYYIHRIEVANTMLAMKVRQGWSELPAEFLSEYEKELKFLAKFRTA